MLVRFSIAVGGGVGWGTERQNQHCDIYSEKLIKPNSSYRYGILHLAVFAISMRKVN